MTLFGEIVWRIDCTFNITEKIEKIRHKQWNNNPHNSVFCCICGQTLNPAKSKYCPEECGWWKIKDIYSTRWICHSCNGHHETNWVNVDDLSDTEIDRLLKEEKLPKYFRK